MFSCTLTVKARIIAGITLAILVMGGGATALSVYSMRTTAEATFQQASTQALRIFSQHISSLLEDADNCLESLSKDPDFLNGQNVFPRLPVQTEFRLRHDDLSPEARKALKPLLTQLSSRPAVSEIYATFSNGAYIATLPDDTLPAGMDMRRRDWYTSRFSSSEAAGHYLRRSVMRRNERLLAERPSRFRRYVGSPAGTEGVRLDTVLREGTGDFVYDYVQVIPALPGLRKVQVSLSGEIYGHESVLYTMPPADTMTFYVSSISTLCDSRWKDMVRDTASYMRGIRLLEDRDYKAALEALLPFRDYNTAVALVALGRDRYALDLLGDCPPTAGVNYLLAIVHARLGHEKKAAGYLAAACAGRPSFRHRARLDPEIAGLIERYETDMEH